MVGFSMNPGHKAIPKALKAGFLGSFVLVVCSLVSQVIGGPTIRRVSEVNYRRLLGPSVSRRNSRAITRQIERLHQVKPRGLSVGQYTSMLRDGNGKVGRFPENE